MEMAGYSEMSVKVYHTMFHHVPEDNNADYYEVEMCLAANKKWKVIMFLLFHAIHKIFYRTKMCNLTVDNT